MVEQPEPVTQPQAASNRQFLRPASPSGSLPHSQDSSSLAPPNLSETDGASGGRERRTRKSVNYAEPKLNTCVPSSLFQILFVLQPRYIQENAKT